MLLPRRAFLRTTGALVASTVTSSLAAQAIASPAIIGLKEKDCRTLAFDCLNTGEKLTIDYWIEGRYMYDALSRINMLLRDFRTGEVHAMEPKLLDLLHQLGREIDTDSYQVISGYRSPITNAMLHEKSAGVAVKSLHMQGQAIDIRVPDRSLEKVNEAALKLAVGGVGYYPKSNFVHVDVGRVRKWVG